MMQKISKAELAARLEARVECAEGGMEGLNILLYGWKRFRKYGAKYLQAPSTCMPWRRATGCTGSR